MQRIDLISIQSQILFHPDMKLIKNYCILSYYAHQIVFCPKSTFSSALR